MLAPAVEGGGRAEHVSVSVPSQIVPTRDQLPGGGGSRQYKGVVQRGQSSQANETPAPVTAPLTEPFRLQSLGDAISVVIPAEGVASPIWAAMLRLINELPLKPSTRQAIQGHSTCLGASTLGGGAKLPTITAFTREHKDAVSQLVHLMCSLPGFDPKFCFSSLQIGQNTTVEPHRDSANEGPSAALGLGCFEKGFLVVGRRVLDIRHRIVYFDGRSLHHTTQHSGQRISIIAFVHTAARRLSDADCRELKAMGFRLRHQLGDNSAEASASALVRTPPVAPVPEPTAAGRGQKHRRLTGPDLVKATADELLAAKPVRWAGRGELLQLPWRPKMQGTLLVIDLWAGVSTLLLSLLALGVNFVAVSAENSPDGEVQKLAAQAFPQAVVVENVEDICAAMLAPVLKRRKFAAILIGGGSPCQGNSGANPHRKGLGDKRSWQPLQLERIANEVSEISGGVPVLRFLENVASAPTDVLAQYDQIMGCGSLTIDAKVFGWVQRRRRMWGRGPSVRPTKPLPARGSSLS